MLCISSVCWRSKARLASMLLIIARTIKTALPMLALFCAGTADAGAGGGAVGGPGPGGLTWEGVVEDVRKTLPDDVWRVMSPEFYLTFWSLSFEDIFVPSDRSATASVSCLHGESWAPAF